MKAVILHHAPGSQLIDATHTVPQFDIQAGSFLLWAATRSFDPGSIHLAVVDPGVGTARRRLAFRNSDGSVYVGPDNGLFSDVLGGSGEAVEVVDLAVPDGASRTFEGRDVFAPAAGRVAAGARLTELGSPTGQPRRLPFSGGRVVWVDNFGNLVTNLRPPAGALRVGRHLVSTWAGTFAEAPGEGPFFYRGSLGYLEVGVREGRADEALQAHRGSPAEVVPPGR